MDGVKHYSCYGTALLHFDITFKTKNKPQRLKLKTN